MCLNHLINCIDWFLYAYLIVRRHRHRHRYNVHSAWCSLRFACAWGHVLIIGYGNSICTMIRLHETGSNRKSIRFVLKSAFSTIQMHIARWFSFHSIVFCLAFDSAIVVSISVAVVLLLVRLVRMVYYRARYSLDIFINHDFPHVQTHATSRSTKQSWSKRGMSILDTCWTPAQMCGEQNETVFRLALLAELWILDLDAHLQLLWPIIIHKPVISSD